MDFKGNKGRKVWQESWPAIGSLLLLINAGCGGNVSSGSGGEPISGENTEVTVLATSTATGQVSRFPLFLNSLTFTSESGKTVTVLPSPQQVEFMHLNGASDTHSVSFSVGGGGAFLGILDTTLKNQNTLTWTNKWSETTTKMVGQTAAINIAEPSPSNGYDGPSQFEVYQDNVYGTFMCYPTQ
jgi:hypothetical protein